MNVFWRPLQQLLLDDLYQTRMCHNLLVDAENEDFYWKLRGPKPPSRVSPSGMHPNAMFIES